MVKARMRKAMRPDGRLCDEVEEVPPEDNGGR